MRKPYKTDLTDAQWKIVKPLIPPAKPGGRPREVDMREVLNTLLYQARTGCQWDLLPHDLLPKSTVWDYFPQWRDDGTWQRIDRRPAPKVRAAGARPDAAGRLHRQPDGQGDRGRRRAGLRRGQEDQRAEAAHGGGLAGSAAGGGGHGGLADDGAAAPGVLGSWTGAASRRLETVWGDAKYRNHDLAAWLEPARAVRGRGGGATAGVGGVREAAEAVGGRSGRSRGGAGTGGTARTTSGGRSRVRRGPDVSAIGQMLRRLAPDGDHQQAPFRYKRPAA